MSRLPDDPETDEPIQEPTDNGSEPAKDDPKPEGEEAPDEPPNNLDDGPLVAAS